MKQFFASRPRKLIEHVAGGIGECGAEAQHLLEFFARIQHDSVAGSGVCSFPGQVVDRGITKFAAGHADSDIPLRSRRQHGREISGGSGG